MVASLICLNVTLRDVVMSRMRLSAYPFSDYVTA